MVGLERRARICKLVQNISPYKTQTHTYTYTYTYIYTYTYATPNPPQTIMKFSSILITFVALFAGANASCRGDCKIRCNAGASFCPVECIGRCMAAVCPEYVNSRRYGLHLLFMYGSNVL